MNQMQQRVGPDMSTYADDQLFVLPTTLLEEFPERVSELEGMARVLKKDFGWHYMLDLIWATRQTDALKSGATVLDAGAGTGLIQWWLADREINVISIDRMPRYFRPELRAWCPIIEFESGKEGPTFGHISKSIVQAAQTRLFLKRSIACAGATIRDSVLHRQIPGARSAVRVLEGDLMNLREIESESIDAVVSISSLEHNSPENLKKVVQELMRVLRPGGRIVATLGSAKDRDWYHEPSSGWCYTQETLADIFDLTPGFQSNYEQYDDLFESLVNCRYLRENLGDFYSKAGNNGMPWGRWDPQYQSVGVVKVKR